MKLSSDKVLLAVLYYLYSEEEPEGDPEGIARAIGQGITPAIIKVSLERLCNLGFVVWKGPMPLVAGQVVVPGYDWCAITHDGHDFAYKLIRQPKSFLGRLHSEGFDWLSTKEAQKAKLSIDLSKHGITVALEEIEKAQKKPLNRLAAFFGISRFLLDVLVALAAIATIGGFLIVLNDKGWL